LVRASSLGLARRVPTGWGGKGQGQGLRRAARVAVPPAGVFLPRRRVGTGKAGGYLGTWVMWCYTGGMKTIRRVQTGLRIEKRLLKVLKGLAENFDISLAELVEAITLHAFENRPPFSTATLEKISRLKAVYDLDLVADDSHSLSEEKPPT